MARDLLIPGTGGTKLVLDGTDIGWPGELTVAGWLAKRSLLSVGFEEIGAKFGSPETIEKVLTMEHDDDPSVLAPVKTTLVPGGTLVAGQELRLAYNQFQDFDAFPYDWRQDIRHSGNQLLAKLTTPGEPWRIVAHSQGGLVVVAAACALAARQGGDDRAFAKLVSHVVFLGVPLHGTMNAASAFIKGENLAAPFRDGFRRIVRTWPAVHQMLPTWGGSVRTRTPAGEIIDSLNLHDAEPWQDQNMRPSMLRRAVDARNSCFRSPLVFMNGVKILILQSRAHSTQDHVLRVPGGLDLGGDVRGDSLVPDDITRAMGGAAQRRVTFSIGSDRDTMVHFALGTDPSFATSARDFLAQ